MRESDFETVIRPRNGWFDLDLDALWRYRDLIKLFVRRNLIVTYKQSVLGPIWIILNPLLQSLIYTFVFGKFAGIPTDGLPYMLFYMCGTTLWTLFSSGVNNCARTFLDNSGTFGKVYFPRMSIVVATAITAVINYGIQFALLMIFYLYYALTGTALAVTWAWLLLPVLLLQCTLLGTSVGLIVSSLTVRYRDLMFLLSTFIQLWMYVTPVIYPLSTTGGYMRVLLLLNPMTAIMQNYRSALLGQGEFLTGWWAVSAGVTVVLCGAAVVMFSRVEKNFIDRI